MRIVLIGAGAVGSVAAARLVDVREVDELVLADVVGERSKALADRLGSRKVRAATMASGQDLGSLITGADLAVNAAHASLDLPLMEACLDVGASFMDLSSVPLQQFPYDEKFRKAGIVALLGAGEDPGLGNVLARAAADRLDKVDSIRIRDGDTITSGPTPLPVAWSPETFIVEVFADALVFQDGRMEVTVDSADWIASLFTCAVQHQATGYASYCNPQVDELFAKTQTTFDEAERAQLFRQIEDLVMADAPMLPLINLEYFVLVNPRVKGYSSHLLVPPVNPWVWIEETQ